MLKKLYDILTELYPILFVLSIVATCLFIIHMCLYEETIIRIDNARVTSIVVHRNFFGKMNTMIDIEEPYIGDVCITSDTIPNQISGYVVTRIPAFFDCQRTYYPSMK